MEGHDDGLRKFILFKSRERRELEEHFVLFDSSYRKFLRQAVEPLYNLVCAKDGEDFLLLTLLRAKHRPGSYFAEGDEKILLSPASVDVCGVCITPREDDFYKVNEEILEKIFTEVFISREMLIDLGKLVY